MERNIFKSALVALAITLAGCGGGGGNTIPGASPVTTSIKGVASKGVIANGTVNIYSLTAAGAKGPLLQTVTTNGSGNYSTTVSYTGPVLIEASGAYTDEATGQVVTIPVDTPLHAVHDNATGTVNVSVTPLTELAFELAGPTLTAATIKAANATVVDLFKVDAVTVAPCEPTATALSGATQDQVNYTLLLATISELAKPAGGGSSPAFSSVMSVIAGLASDISSNSGGMSAPAASGILAALEAFLQDQSHNQTGITTVPAALTLVGWRTLALSLATSGVSPATVYGVDSTVALPSGVTVAADGAGNVQASALVLSGAGLYTAGTYVPATGSANGTVRIALISSAPFGSGVFAKLYCSEAPGTSVASTDFSVLSGYTLFGATGAGLGVGMISLSLN